MKDVNGKKCERIIIVIILLSRDTIYDIVNSHVTSYDMFSDHVTGYHVTGV